MPSLVQLITAKFTGWAIATLLLFEYWSKYRSGHFRYGKPVFAGFLAYTLEDVASRLNQLLLNWLARGNPGSYVTQFGDFSLTHHHPLRDQVVSSGLGH
jgi:hypothetical protein